MKANFKLVLRSDQKDKQGRSLLFLRITSYHKVKYFSTGRRIPDRFWNKEREQVRSGHPDAVELNQYLEDFVRTARDRFRSHGFDLKSMNKKSIVPDVISFLDQVIKDYERPEHFRTQKKFVTLKNKLMAFAKTSKIPFDSIDKNFVLEFDNFLKLSHGNGTNTRVKYIKVLRQTVNRAVEEGVTKTPFPKVRLREEPGDPRPIEATGSPFLRNLGLP